MFTYLTRIKSNERSGLSPEHAEDLLRIIINGSRDFKKFDGVSFAKEFLKTHARVDDETFQGGRLPKRTFEYKSSSRLF